MKQSYPHKLDPAKAKMAATATLESLKKRLAEYNPSFQWASEKRALFNFEAKMTRLTGYLDIRDNSIDFELKVPFLLRMFTKQAMDVLNGEVMHWIKQAEANKL